MILVRTVAIVRRVYDSFRVQPFYYVAQGIWLAQNVPNWIYLQGRHGFPFAVDSYPDYTPGSQDPRFAITEKKVVLVSMISVLAVGVALKALVTLTMKRSLGTTFPGPRRSSETSEQGKGWRICVESRVPSVLVGWGIGYWVTTFLAMLVCAWHKSECEWQNPPITVKIISYVIFPFFLSAGLLMVIDSHLLGTRFAAFVKPAVDILTNRGRVEYWVMATIYRDFVLLWMGYCNVLRKQLDH